MLLSAILYDLDTLDVTKLCSVYLLLLTFLLVPGFCPAVFKEDSLP